MSLISEVDITTWRHGRWYAIIAHPMHATMPKYRVVAVHDRAISSLKVPLPHSNYSMDTASALTAAAINDLRSAQMSRYFDYASVAFWIYEFFLVIDLEKSLVWSSRWSAIKIAYLTTKYTFLVECLLLVVTYVYASPTYCKIVYITTDFLIFVAACIAEGLLAYRVWIVLGMGRRLGYILSILCLSGLVLGGGSIWTAVILMGIHGTVPLNTGIFLAGCPPMHHNSPVADLAGFGFLVVICIYVPMLTGLMTFHYFRSRTERLGRSKNLNLREKLLLMGLVPYYFLMIMTFLTLITMLSIGFHLWMGRLQRVAHSVIACRVILDTKDNAKRTESMSHISV